MQNLKKIWTRNDGSTLVGAVAISALLAIAAAGLIGVSRNTVSQEVDSFNDARAYNAAEAGIMIGANWMNNGGAAGGATVFPLNPLILDGIEVTISLDINAAPAGWARLISQARYPDGADSELNYIKQLEWEIRVIPAGVAGDNQLNVDNMGNRAIDGASNFDGPVVFNRPIIINQMNALNNNHLPRFRGAVSVVNIAPNAVNLNYGDSPKGNFNGGLIINSHPTGAPGLASTLANEVFMESYRTRTTPSTITWETDPVEDFPINTPPLPAGLNLVDARVWFEGDRIFYGNPGTTAQAVAQRNSEPIPQSGGPYFVEFNNDITVIPGPTGTVNGTMSGRLTVRALGGSNITFNLGDNGTITYTGVNINAGVTLNANGTTTNNNNNIAAFSNSDGRPRIDNEGNNYRIGDRTLPGGQTSLLAFFTDNGDIRIIQPPSNNRANIVTAQLFAPQGTIAFGTVNATGVFTRNMGLSNPSFSFRAIGCAAMRDWWIPPTVTMTNTNTHFFALFDRNAPRAAGVRLEGEGVVTPPVFERRRWRETNIPII